MSKQTTLTGPTVRTSDKIKSVVDRAIRVSARMFQGNRSKIFFNGLTALLAGGFTYFISGLIPYYPGEWRWLLTLAVIIFWGIKPNLGVAFTLGVFLLPIAYNSLTLALVFILLLLFVSIVEIGALGPYGFLVVAGTTLIFLHPQQSTWLLLAPLMAGFLGVRRGVVLGALACFWAQALAIISGQSKIGILIISGQATPLIPRNPNPVSSFFDFGWLSAQVDIGKLDTELISKLFTPFIERPTLLVQVGLWALTAGVLGVLLSKSLVQKIPARYTAVAGGLLVLGAGYLALPNLFGEGVTDLGAMVLPIVAPAVLVAIAAPLLEIAASVMTSPTLEGTHLGEVTPQKVGSRNTANDLAGVDDTRAEPLINPVLNPMPAQLILGNGVIDTHTWQAKSKSYEVFISYSSRDKPIADDVCAQLEAAGLRCWVAPRDVGPGEDWPTAIAIAVAASRVMVLVFSQNSNESEEVSRELYLAAKSKAIIVPFRIENVNPEPGKAYYLGRTHWLDATNPPTREQIGQLIQKIHFLVTIGNGSGLPVHKTGSNETQSIGDGLESPEANDAAGSFR